MDQTRNKQRSKIDKRRLKSCLKNWELENSENCLLFVSFVSRKPLDGQKIFHLNLVLCFFSRLETRESINSLEKCRQRKKGIVYSHIKKRLEYRDTSSISVIKIWKMCIILESNLRNAENSKLQTKKKWEGLTFQQTLNYWLLLKVKNAKSWIFARAKKTKLFQGRFWRQTLNNLGFATIKDGS